MDLKAEKRKELKQLQFSQEEVLKIPVFPEKFLEYNLQCASDILDSSKLNDNGNENKIIQNGMSFPFSADSSLRFATIKTAKLLTSGFDVKRVLDISVDMDGLECNCLPGDTVGIVPQNVPDEVEELLKYLGLTQQSDSICTIKVLSGTKKKNAAIPLYLPTVSVLRELLKTCVDIRAIPKKAFLRVLCEYTSDELERRRLEELCSQQGAEAYTKLILNNGVCLLDILQNFPSCVPPLDRLLEHLPRLQARPYSIALQEGNNLRFAVTVVESGVGGRQGLCSGWLNDVSKQFIGNGELHNLLQKMTLDGNTQNVKIPMYMRISSSFRVPENPSVSIIMVGPGTGVAPFIGFLKYRSVQKIASSAIQFGYSWLFFGCRYKNRDYLFRTEIEEFLSQGILNKLSVSFSRDEKLERNNHHHVKYVQDNIKKEKQQFVTQFLEDNNVTFICGDAKHMAKDVQETIILCIQEVKGINETEAKELFSKLVKEKRYIQDIWL